MNRVSGPATAYPSMCAVAVSDRGSVRDHNEDTAFAGPHLIAVADGIGGLPAGEVASDLTIRALATAEDVRSLREAVTEADGSIRAAVEADPSLAGMGTTLTALLLQGTRLTLVHIGDSRAYRRRGESTARITRDDTFVQELVERGVLKPDEIRHHPHRSVVTRALQGRGEDPTWTSLRADPGDRYLICSDGLSDVVDDGTIGATLAEHTDLDECAQRLVDLALRAGGPDNITVVVADIVAG
jgi:serine/threonine protein phosphatase PrpC